MKRIIFLLALMMATVAGNAQINIGGDFKRTGASGCFETVYDTVEKQSGVAITDSFWTPLNPFRNSVGFQVSYERVTGADTAKIILYGTKVAGGQTGWVKLEEHTVTNAQGMQYIDFEKPGAGNPYNGYLFVYSPTTVATNTKISWKAHALIR